MAPPRKHSTDVILDAARALVLAEGPRSASVAAIAARSGAPAGTLYHRFGNRDGILTAAWLRALERFQTRAKAAAQLPDPLEAGVALARSAIVFAREEPHDARLLLNTRPSDLIDGPPDDAFTTTLAAMNAPMFAEVRRIASALTGADDPRNLDAVARAIVDLPYSAVRRHGRTDPLPEWLEEDIADAARTLLTQVAPAER